VARLRLLAAARAEVAASAEPGPAVTPPESAATPPSDRRSASGQLTPSLRKFGTGEWRVSGVFRSIQCRQGTVILQVQTATALMSFAAGQLE
jgi:hypothetical protein